MSLEYDGIIAINARYDMELFLTKEQLAQLEKGETLQGKIINYGSEKVDDLTLKLDKELNGVNYLEEQDNIFNFRIDQWAVRDTIKKGQTGRAYSGGMSLSDITLYNLSTGNFDVNYTYWKQKVESKILAGKHSAEWEELIKK